MPELGRWNGMDQLSEAYSSFSPYAYVANNPVNSIDPDGRKIIYNDQQAMEAEYRTWFSGGGGGFASYFGGGGRGFSSEMNAYFGNTGSGWGTTAGPATFGGTQAYRDIMHAAASGLTAGLSNNFGVLSWWTDANGAQYGQYNMMKFATPSDDKWEGGSYGAITGLSSYLANLIGSTNETFYSFSGGSNDPDKETLNKLRPHDKIEANNMFEYIINGYGRAIKAVNVSPDKFQLGIDIASLLPFVSNEDILNGNIAMVEQVYDSPFSYNKDDERKK